VNDDVVMAKLESLERCVTRIRSKIPDDYEKFVADLDSQEIIALNLERSVQLCVDVALRLLARQRGPALPGNMGDAFRQCHELEMIDSETASQLISAVGFRNVSVHSYKDLDPEIVWSILQKDLGVFSRFARQILAL
jgi:uncharacterized protein YutE (UPF0331/DUF86 family)